MLNWQRVRQPFLIIVGSSLTIIIIMTMVAMIKINMVMRIILVVRKRVMSKVLYWYRWWLG